MHDAKLETVTREIITRYESELEKVRLDEERSDELTTQSQAAKTARACTSIPDAPLRNHRNNLHPTS